MEIYTIQRPSLLPTAACAPSASWLPVHESVVVTVAERAQLPQAHQVSTQAELARVRVTVGGSYGTNGFLGSTGIVAAKRMADGASGVPPRGRPV